MLLTALAISAISAQVAKVYPVDEADRDPSLLVFRLRLVEAVALRDTAFVYDHLDENVQNSFGGDGGVAEFKEMWRLGEPESELWPTLATILGGGGSHHADAASMPSSGAVSASFEAPYWSSLFPAREYDPFGYGVVIGEDVRVRAGPTQSAAVLASLSYDLVRVVDFFPALNQPEPGVPEGWVQVELATGAIGYVAEPSVGSAVGWRALFHKGDGRWMITALVAGD